MRRCTALFAEHRVAVVGGGPSGFYSALYALKAIPESTVDVYDKLPVPFGLARYGVAPDHPEVKNVGISFTDLMEQEATRGRVRFHGNVAVGDGGEVSVGDLLRHYHQVVVAVGADDDRAVGIAGESEHVVSARSFVEWYNGFPGAAPPARPLSEIQRVAIIGNGNVALDCARILLAPVDHLDSTDITMDALKALGESRVRRVDVAARRGVLNTAFTIKEFREMLQMMPKDQAWTAAHPDTPWLDTHIHNADSTVDPSTLDRKRQRLVKLIMQSKAAAVGQAERSFHLQYLRRPVEATAEGLVTEKMRIAGDELEGRVEGTGEMELIPADMILRSVGYKSNFADATVPFDAKAGRIPSYPSGRVLRSVDGVAELRQGKHPDVHGRLYSVGWVKNGPTGVIVAAMVDGKTVAHAMADDAAAARGDAACTGEGFDGVKAQLRQPTTWTTWQAIREEERVRGEAEGKVAEKLTTVEEMMKFA